MPSACIVHSAVATPGSDTRGISPHGRPVIHPSRVTGFPSRSERLVLRSWKSGVIHSPLGRSCSLEASIVKQLRRLGSDRAEADRIDLLTAMTCVDIGGTCTSPE